MAEKGDKGMAIEIRDDKLVYFKIGFNTTKKKYNEDMTQKLEKWDVKVHQLFDRDLGASNHGTNLRSPKDRNFKREYSYRRQHFIRSFIYLYNNLEAITLENLISRS